MNSSISNFRTELKVLLVVAIVLGILEISERIMNARRPNEQALMHDFPAVADHLATERGTSMILLGNSLTWNGYDMPLLKSQLDASGHGDLHVEKIAQTGSAPAEWYHNFKGIFVRRGKTPKFIVINMSPSGIADGLPAGYRVGWLANETDWRDVPEVLFKDVANVEVDGQYLQARVLKLYADRWDIRVGLLHWFVPNLWTGMKWVNSTPVPERPKLAAPPPPPTYSLYTRMLDLAEANHAQVILVAMPAREPYPLDEQAIVILCHHGGTFIDSRIIPDLTAADFEDGWHLNPAGAKVFTMYMATQLPAAVRQSFVMSRPIK